MAEMVDPREKQPSRQSRKVRATRKRLLDASRELFAEKGIDLTTIDDITTRADVGKGTFYYHFSDKNDIIAELITQLLGELVRAMKKRCKGVHDLPTLLDTIILVHVEFFNSRWEDFVLYYQGRADLQLKEGYSGLELPFFTYLEAIENLVDSAIKYRIPKPLLTRIGCAVAGFLSGYYSFVAVATENEEVEQTLMPLRGALVSSLTRFINEAMNSSMASDQRERPANGTAAGEGRSNTKPGEKK